MKVLHELEQLGFVFSVEGGKLTYRYNGKEQPNNRAASLLAEVKASKDDAVKDIQNHIIIQAWNGQLDQPYLIVPSDEWRDFWGGAVWLCPDEVAKSQIKKKDKIYLALTTKEFFNVCEVIVEQCESAKSVLECLRLFGGSIEENKGVA